jgi:5'-methylthioadenosine phosphorylase
VRALLDAGCDRVLALSSVGALHVDTAVGTLVVPHDFVALHGPVAAYHDARSHIVPAFDAKWRAQVLDAVRTESPTVVDGGVYWESTGPRFETPAEVRMLAQFADLVGMTAASEAVVAQEVGLRYAVLCVVDNLANGLRADPLTFDEFEAGKGATGPAVLALLDAVVPILA